MTRLRFTRKGAVIAFFALVVLTAIGVVAAVLIDQANRMSQAGNPCAYSASNGQCNGHTEVYGCGSCSGGSQSCYEHSCDNTVLSDDGKKCQGTWGAGTPVTRQCESGCSPACGSGQHCEGNTCVDNTAACTGGVWTNDDSSGTCNGDYGCRTQVCVGGPDNGATRPGNCSFCNPNATCDQGGPTRCQVSGNNFQCVHFGGTCPSACVAPCEFVSSSGNTSGIEVIWYCEGGYTCSTTGGVCAQRCQGADAIDYKYTDNGVVRHTPDLDYPEFCYNKQKDYYSQGGTPNPVWTSFVGHRMSQRQHKITDPECQPTVVNNPPLCRSLNVSGGTPSGGRSNRIVTETQPVSVTVTGYDPDGRPSQIALCYTIAGQNATFYTTTTPINPWICTSTSNPTQVTNGYSYTLSNLTFATMRAAIRQRLTTLTDAQINSAGIQIVTNIMDNASGPFCSTNIGYRNGAGVLVPNGTTACDGDSCTATLVLRSVTPDRPACYETGCVAAGGCSDGSTCNTTTNRCENPDCSTESDCVCPTNPNWNVEKTPALVCLDDGMETSTATVTYNVDVTYTNPDNAPGTLNTVVDRPQGVMVDWVDANGFVPAGAVVTPSTTNPDYVDNITWTLTGALATFTPDPTTHTVTKRFTYVVNIPAGTDGVNYTTYTNTVSIYSTSTTPLDTDTATIPVTCIPETGIFDETWGRVGLGLILLGVGMAYVYYEGSNNVLTRIYHHGSALIYKDAKDRMFEEKVLRGAPKKQARKKRS